MTYKIFIVMATIMASSTLLGGCSNTLEGAGKDMQGMGQWVEDTF